MSASCRDLALPRWFRPAASTFDSALGAAGVCFDILLAPISRVTPAPRVWQPLNPFWYQTLQLWQTI